MKVFFGLSKAELEKDAVITIGIFDGVHLGHRYLVRQVVKRAQEGGLLAGAVTFDPHPREVLFPHESTLYLTTLEEKIALLEELGLDFLVVIPFTEAFASTSAEGFVSSLCHNLRMREVWVGEGFVFGNRREGDTEALRRLGFELGFEVRVVEPFCVRGRPVSSSQIRALLLEGQVEEAKELLGRYPTVVGRVVRGVGRGRALGFPTANLGVEGRHLIPADGVYAVRAHWSGKNHPAVANIGLRPTFGEGERLVEAHLLDFEGDLYGERVSLEFIKRLRPEVKFASAEELVAQMHGDVAEAREVLSSGSSAKSRQGDICRYQEIEHTADRAIRAYGRDLPELFANAAHGMFSLMADLERLSLTVERRLSLEASDREALLVDWLSELLYLHEMEREIYNEFIIDHLSSTKLEGVAKGGKGLESGLVIKAVTYHDLKIEETERGYSATVVFDV